MANTVNGRKFVVGAMVMALILILVAGSQSHPSLIDGNSTLRSIRRTFDVDAGSLTLYGDERDRGRGGLVIRDRNGRRLTSVYFDSEPISADIIAGGAPKGQLIMVVLRSIAAGQEYQNTVVFSVIGTQIRAVLSVPTLCKLDDSQRAGMTALEFKANQSFYGFVWPQRWRGQPGGGWTRLYACQVHTTPVGARSGKASTVGSTWEIPSDMSSVVIREFRYDTELRSYRVTKSAGNKDLMLGQGL